MTVECWTQRTIVSRLPLYFSLFDSFPPSQCGFYQKLKDYCRVFPQINNESIAKPSSRFVDSNGPHTTLCYHSAKGHFAASKYSWIFGKHKFIVFMSGKFIWTACPAHMQIFSIRGGMMLFLINWMYNFISSQPSLDNIHALVHCFTNSSLARREGLKFQDTVYECVRADRFSVYAKKVRWPRNLPHLHISHNAPCLPSPKILQKRGIQFFFRWLRDRSTQGLVVWKLISANPGSFKGGFLFLLLKSTFSGNFLHSFWNILLSNCRQKE